MNHWHQWLWQPPETKSENRRFDNRAEYRRYIFGCYEKLIGEVCIASGAYLALKSVACASLAVVNTPLLSAAVGCLIIDFLLYKAGSIWQGVAHARASFETGELKDYNLEGIRSCIRNQALNPLAL